MSMFLFHYPIITSNRNRHFQLILSLALHFLLIRTFEIIYGQSFSAIIIVLSSIFFVIGWRWIIDRHIIKKLRNFDINGNNFVEIIR